MIYIDVRDSKGYTVELEELRRNNSEFILKVNFKQVLAKKLWLRVWGYSQGKYLYLLSNRELKMKYKTYSIAKPKGFFN